MPAPGAKRCSARWSSRRRPWSDEQGARAWRPAAEPATWRDTRLEEETTARAPSSWVAPWLRVNGCPSSNRRAVAAEFNYQHVSGAIGPGVAGGAVVSEPWNAASWANFWTMHRLGAPFAYWVIECQRGRGPWAEVTLSRDGGDPG